MQTGNSNIDSTMMTPLILKREEVTPMEVYTNAPASNVFKVDGVEVFSIFFPALSILQLFLKEVV